MSAWPDTRGMVSQKPVFQDGMTGRICTIGQLRPIYRSSLSGSLQDLNMMYDPFERIQSPLSYRAAGVSALSVTFYLANPSRAYLHLVTLAGASAMKVINVAVPERP